MGRNPRLLMQGCCILCGRCASVSVPSLKTKASHGFMRYETRGVHSNEKCVSLDYLDLMNED